MILYLDASALMKRYLSELGSAGIARKLGSGNPVYSSALCFGEVFAVLGRKYQARELTQKEFAQAKDEFLGDWSRVVQVIELSMTTMSYVPDLVSRYPLKGGDAVHLSAALWLKAETGLTPEFVAADKSLNRAAGLCGLPVFNPETD